jgi:hypothetical protein
VLARRAKQNILGPLGLGARSQGVRWVGFGDRPWGRFCSGRMLVASSLDVPYEYAKNLEAILTIPYLLVPVLTTLAASIN